MTPYWIIKVKLPSGAQMAFSHYKNQFALVAIDGEKVMAPASTWPTHQEAEKYLKLILEGNPQLKKMAPFEICQAYKKETKK